MDDQIDKIGELARLESVDLSVFDGDQQVPQEVCSFVLTLSLIYNDLKDLMRAFHFILSLKPENGPKVSRYWGDYGGLTIHIDRMLISFVREVLGFIEENKNILDHPFFKSVLRQIKTEHRESWGALVEAALDMQTKNPFSNFLKFIRNKVAFHYEAKEIYSGYKTYYNSTTRGVSRAFLSRGTNMPKTRYYFADGAAQGCLVKRNAAQSLKDVADTLIKLNFTLMEIIHHFIQKRGQVYRQEEEET